MISPAISDATTVVVARDVLASELGAELVMLNLADGIYYGLDGVGAAVWKLVQTPVTVAVICQELIAAYDVDPELCRADVLKLLTDLSSRGLVDVR